MSVGTVPPAGLHSRRPALTGLRFLFLRPHSGVLSDFKSNSSCPFTCLRRYRPPSVEGRTRAYCSVGWVTGLPGVTLCSGDKCKP